MALTLGTRNDREKIYQILSKEMHPEVGSGKISPEKALDRIDLCLNDGIVFILRDGEEIQATVGLFPTQWWYTDQNHLTDAWFFVRKDHRKPAVFRELMRAIKSLPNVYLGIGSEIEIERKERLFSKFGKRCGALYKVS